MKKLSVLLSIIILFACFNLSAETIFSPCSTNTPEDCSETILNNMNDVDVIACFQSLSVSSDNGATWESIFDATGINGIEVTLTDLGNGADLTSVKGLKVGMLKTNTSYTCAKASLSSMIATQSDGTSCNLTNVFKNKNNIEIASMFIRGNNDCPGNNDYPTFTPFNTTDETTLDLKFNTNFQKSGPPIFTIMPTSGGEIASSNMDDIKIASNHINQKCKNWINGTCK